METDAHSYATASASETDEQAGLAAQRSQFAALLGIEKPVDEKVFSAALQDQSYATNLLLTKDTPVFRDQLLANPPALVAAPIGSGELLKRGAEALWRWSRTGFSHVADDVLRSRLDACQACPNLSAPPQDQTLLYRLAGTAAGSKSVCRLCGCPVARKAAMTFEQCPDAHPEIEGLSRWGEQVINKS